MKTRPRILVLSQSGEEFGDDSLQPATIVSTCEWITKPVDSVPVDRLCDESPDVVLLHQSIGSARAVQIARDVRTTRTARDIPLIYCADAREPGGGEAFLRAGGDDCIFLPCQPEEMGIRIRHQIGSSAGGNSIAGRTRRLRSILRKLCHDLSNSVGAIDGLLNAFSTDPQSLFEVRAELSSMSLQAVELIRNVRELWFLEDVGGTLPLETAGLASAVRKAAECVHERLAAKELSLTVEIGADILVEIEPATFTRSVVPNLLTNAIKFSPRGGSIRISAFVENTKEVRLNIEDHGIGMAPDLAAAVLLPESTLSRPGTEEEPGNGIGLQVAKNFIAAYGGRLMIHSLDLEHHPDCHGTNVAIILLGGLTSPGHQPA